MIDPEDLRKIDRELLEILTDGKHTGEPWGRITPEYAHERLIDDYNHSVKPQYVQQRLEHLRGHDHLEKIGRGLYELTNDPREETHDA